MAVLKQNVKTFKGFSQVRKVFKLVFISAFCYQQFTYMWTAKTKKKKKKAANDSAGRSNNEQRKAQFVLMRPDTLITHHEAVVVPSSKCNWILIVL